MSGRVFRAYRVNTMTGTMRVPAICACMLATLMAACGSMRADERQYTAANAKHHVASTGARAEDGPMLNIVCTGAGSVLVDGDPSRRAVRGDTQDIIDVRSLVIYEHVGKEAVRRRGARAVESKCGALTIAVSGGFYNENPEGELGAADDYAVVSVRAGEKQVMAPVAIGSCVEGNPRYERHAPCPGGWAKRLEIHMLGDSYRIQLQRDQGE